MKPSFVKMIKSNSGLWLFVSLTILLLSIPLYAVQNTTLQNSISVNNLQAAYAKELNAHTSYLLYAQKADSEGYGKLAELFRVLAKSEKVHVERYAGILIDLDITPVANDSVVVVLTTKENLRQAIEEENYENTVLYPSFAQQARKDKIKFAKAAFRATGDVEGVHAVLLKQAQNNTKKWKNQNVTYYVCQVCGDVSKYRPMLCSVCLSAAKNIKKVD